MAAEQRGLNLVTGGTGLLGSHIVEQLVRRGRPVRALVRRGSDTRFLRAQGAELVEGDITDPDSLQKACSGVATVYHSAARVGDWGPWQEFVDITIEGTRHLLEAAKQAGVQRFLHVSSISAYGHVDGKNLVLDETAPLGRQLHRWSYYSRAKVAAEKLVWGCHERGELVVTVVRPSWLYGPRDRASISRLCGSLRRGKLRIIGDGRNRLNLAHAGNVAEAIIMAAESPAGAGEAFNCSNDGTITQEEYFNALAAALGEPRPQRHVPYRVAHTAAFLFELFGHLFGRKTPPLVTRYSVWLIGRRCFFDCSKARRVLGWQPTVLYERGIPEAVTCYLHPEAPPGPTAAPAPRPPKVQAVG